MAGPLYDAACCQAQGGDLDGAFATLDRAIASGLDDPAIQNDADLAPLRADRRWPALLARVAALRAKSEAAVGNPALRDTLLAIERDDQAAREVDARTTEAGDRREARLAGQEPRR